MSVGPRIVFTRFASSASPKLRPWREHVRRVTGSLPEVIGLEPDTSPVIVWNLVSANNRELGRGARVYQRFDDAVLGAQRLVAQSAELQVTTVSGDRDGFYGWQASYEGASELVCSRWYQTERDRQHAVAIAMNALSGATLREGARANHPSLMGGERAAFDD
jgi:hypothetical protein